MEDNNKQRIDIRTEKVKNLKNKTDIVLKSLLQKSIENIKNSNSNK